jgi:hypothetical protein
MRHRVYSLYLSTYHETRFALSHDDEARLRALCADAAVRHGSESMLALLAMSDAETGRRPRTIAQVIGLVWRDGEVPAEVACRLPTANRETVRAA